MLRSTLLLMMLGTCSAQNTDDIYNQPITTQKGCKCKSNSCTTSVLVECDAAPFCLVDDGDKVCERGTAHYSRIKGYYDYCVYEPYESYEKLSASQKKALVMAHIQSTTGTSGSYPWLTSIFPGIMGESVMTSFDASADVFPEERIKYIHSVGVTGGIKFVRTGDHGYAGLFQGAEYGLVRFSSAAKPGIGAIIPGMPGSGGVIPGMGIKFFRDGRESANFVAMYSLDGQKCTDKNFFAHDWSNHIGATKNFGLKLAASKFWQASYCSQMVGLSDLASSGDGSQGSFPFSLIFHSLINVDCPCEDYTSALPTWPKSK